MVDADSLPGTRNSRGGTPNIATGEKTSWKRANLVSKLSMARKSNGGGLGVVIDLPPSCFNPRFILKIAGTKKKMLWIL